MANQANMSEVLRKLAEKSVTPLPTAMETVEVEINPKAVVLQEYVTELYANLENAMAARGGALTFTEEEFALYIAMVIKTRVDYANNQRVAVRPTDLLVVPSFLSVVLESVGVVDHIDMGIQLVPVCEGVAVDAAFMQRISRALAVCGAVGLEYSKGYSRSKEGSWDFMTMTLIDGIVKSHSRDAHPVYALLSATLGVTGIEKLLSPRITYGSEGHFKALVKHCAMLKG